MMDWWRCYTYPGLEHALQAIRADVHLAIRSLEYLPHQA
jgi:hypothetical protein